jgi:hypothetical protein
MWPTEDISLRRFAGGEAVNSTCGRGHWANDPLGFESMPEPTKDEVDALVGPATPHFAFQLRARVRALIRELPEEHPVRVYGEEQMELLERLGFSSSKAEEGPLEPSTRPGWETLPSHAPASSPLPKNR